MSTLVPTWELRARFAQRLSDLYGQEVPAYRTLVEVSTQVNQRVLARSGRAAERFGSIDRVTAERHGAIRVGSPRELAQVATVFTAVGMHPTGFYDLRDAMPQPIPVVSTAFRPHAPDELARNPFRVFTSMLVPGDRRFFAAELEARLVEFIEGRELFAPELLELAAEAEAGGGLSETQAQRFLDLAARSFALSDEPVDEAWYATLSAISGVAADIGGVRSTHINHLTPRVLDIDDLYASMSARGIEMIDEIQGPPGWEGPDVLLRQTSFRALAEPRLFRTADGSLTQGELRVRFGEVEQRGIALTPAGRSLFDDLVGRTDARLAEAAERGGDDAAPPVRTDVARDVWREHLPADERELDRAGLAFCTYTVVESAALAPGAPTDLDALLDAGVLRAEPIVYEDFLPRSAAGIFASNLADRGRRDDAAEGEQRDLAWLAEAMGRPIAVPEELYSAQRAASLERAAARLGLERIDIDRPGVDHPADRAAAAHATEGAS